MKILNNLRQIRKKENMSKEDKYQLIFFALSALIPVLVVLYAFYKSELFPFGELSLLNMDLWGQYFPMYTEQNIRRQIFQPMFFSWNGGLGHNIFADAQYYTNSILNFIFIFFNRSTMVYAMNFIILLRFALAGLTFAIMLRFKFGRINIATVAFSAAYSLCGYMIAFMTQPMWTDFVFLLPLIIIGLERLVDDRKPIMYCLLLALTIYTNFYLAFPLCIFLVLYFTLYVVTKTGRRNLKNVKYPIAYFAAASAVSGGLAAFSIMPVIAAVSKTAGASEAVYPEGIELHSNIFLYASRLFPTAEISLVYGMGNIFSGTFVFLLLPLFFLNKRIPVKKKIAYGGMITFLYLSMNVNVLNYMWHGFRFPNQLPVRWSFMVSFILILMAYEAFLKRRGISAGIVAASCFIGGLFIYFVKFLPVSESLGNGIFILMAAQLVLLATLAILRKKLYKKRRLNKILISAFALVIFIDVFLNAATVIPRDVRKSEIPAYIHAHGSMEMINEKYSTPKNEFYRMEMDSPWTFNPGMMYGYKGISYYSSLMNGDVYEFLTEIGYSNYAKNVSVVYSPYFPVLNSLFGIKHIVDRHNTLDLFGMNAVDVIGGYTILENKYPLPLAFMADSGVVERESGLHSGGPVTRQNALMNAVAGYDANVFEPVQSPNIKSENVRLNYNENWLKQYYYRENHEYPVRVMFNYTIPKNGYVIMSHGFRSGDITISYDGITREANFNNPVFNIGTLAEGTNVTVEVTTTEVGIGLWGMSLYMINEDNFSRWHSNLSENSADIISFRDTKIKCTLNVDKEGILFTSIPDDGGWSVKSNGKKLDTVNVGGALLAVELPPGNHTLEFKYNVPGLSAGIMISSICAAALAAYIYFRYKRTTNS